LSKLVAVLVTVAVLGGPTGAWALWHCGDIALSGSPERMLIDPVSGDLFVTREGPVLTRLSEADYQASSIGLPGKAGAMGLDPAARLLYLGHSDPPGLTVLHIDAGDTTSIGMDDPPGLIAIDLPRGLAYVTAGTLLISLSGGEPADTTILTGEPGALAVDPATGMVFVSLESEDLLLRYDPASGDTASFEVGAVPGPIELDPERGEVYIANTAGSSVSIFEIATENVVTIPTGADPGGLALNPETSRLYVATNGNVLEVVDTDSRTSIAVNTPGMPLHLVVDALSDRAFAPLEGGLLLETDSAGDTLLVDLPGSAGYAAFNPILNKCFVSDGPGARIAVFEAADYSGASVPAGGGPGKVRINLRDHRVYTPNWFTHNVTVIEGLTDSTYSFGVADGPNGLAIDPVTGDLFVVCAWSATLVVRRAGSTDTLHAGIGSYSHGIEVNPNTRKVYVANRYSDDVSEIDIATLDTTRIRVGNYPCHVGIDVNLNRVYVPNRSSLSINFIDGVTHDVEYAEAGFGPTICLVDPVRNRIFSPNSNERRVSVVDGTTGETAMIPVGTTPRGIDINLATNTIYVSSKVDGEITVIDGATLDRTPVRCAGGIFEVTVDPWLDRVFTASWDGECIFLIDGNFLNTLKIPVGWEPHSSAYDPELEKLYVSNHAGNSVEIMKLRDKISPRIQVEVDSLPDHLAYTSTPTFTGSAVSQRSPRNYGVMKVLCKVDNLRGPWKEATLTSQGTEVEWEFNADPLLLGRHHLFVCAMDSTAASLTSSSSSALARVSDFVCYEFTVMSPPPETPLAVEGEAVSPDREPVLAWTPTSGPNGLYRLDLALDSEFEAVTRSVDVDGISEYRLSTDDLSLGRFYWRVTAVDRPHGKQSAPSPVYSMDLSGFVPGGSTPVSLVGYPNPAPAAVTFRLAGPATRPARCSVYDVAGRRINVISMVPEPGGLTGTWKPVDSEGERLAPGVYYAEVRSGGETYRRKIILIR
jgi:YVTN family beta-propeller protein